MLTANNTPLAGIGFEQYHRDGGTMACIVARGSYTFDHEANAIHLAENQNIVLADEYDGDPHKGVMLMQGDLVPFKPFADLTVFGQIYAPEGEPAKYLNAKISAGNVEKHIRACGERIWHFDKRKGWKLSESEAILEAEITYLHAVGGRVIGHPDGEVDPRNPIGSGIIHRDFTPTSREFPAPRIDSLSNPITEDILNPSRPQGLGPMSPWWQARSRFAGTYDDEWLENVHPRLPSSFDYRFYQFAHPDLVIPRYFEAGDCVETKGLMTDGGSMKFQIPDVVPWVLFAYRDGREVRAKLNLDGVHLDMRQAPFKLDLTWRAWMETCPSFYRIDLEATKSAKLEGLELVLAGEQGVYMSA